jgi:hypothetical protein
MASNGFEIICSPENGHNVNAVKYRVWIGRNQGYAVAGSFLVVPTIPAAGILLALYLRIRADRAISIKQSWTKFG